MHKRKAVAVKDCNAPVDSTGQNRRTFNPEFAGSIPVRGAWVATQIASTVKNLESSTASLRCSARDNRCAWKPLYCTSASFVFN